MREFGRSLLLVLMVAMTGCGPKETPAPAVPEKSRAELQRAEFFGEAVASDPTVTWKQTGLGVKIIAEGEGVTPGIGDKIRFHYTGKLKDGTVFDDTRPRGQPAEFVLNRLVPGLVTGIQLLKPGGKATFYIPPSLGYGSTRSGKIPPVSGLIFEVELVAVTP
jgi:FKBP-type peptidyl-prolyl cis-trans isomerase